MLGSLKSYCDYLNNTSSSIAVSRSLFTFFLSKVTSYPWGILLMPESSVMLCVYLFNSAFCAATLTLLLRCVIISFARWSTSCFYFSESPYFMAGSKNSIRPNPYFMAGGKDSFSLTYLETTGGNVVASGRNKSWRLLKFMTPWSSISMEACLPMSYQRFSRSMCRSSDLCWFW